MKNNIDSCPQRRGKVAFILDHEHVGSIIKCGWVGIGHFQALLEQKLGQSIHWVRWELSQNFGDSLRQRGHQIRIQVPPQGQRSPIQYLAFFILLILFLHHVVFVLDVSHDA